MKPLNFKEVTTVCAKNQEGYLNLPAHQFKGDDGRVAFCWKMSWKERLHVLFTGIIWHQVLTFKKPLQPQKIETTKPEMAE